MLASLLSRRVLCVLGKGGVGRSVVAASIAVAAARTGRRVCLAEAMGNETMATLFDHAPVGYAGAQVHEGIFAMSITAQQSVEEYLVRTLRFRVLYDLVFRNRAIEPFMNAVMGLGDLITVGKVLDLEWLRRDGSLGPDARGPHQWDLIVFDAPATGHGLGLMHAPQAMMDVTRLGPLYQNARLVRDLLADPARSAAVLVTLPEELPVHEALEAQATLKSRGDIHLAGIVLNAVPPRPFRDASTASRWPEVREAARPLGLLGRSFADSVERAVREHTAAQRWAEELSRGSALPVCAVPRLPARDLDVGHLRQIADALGLWS